MYRRTALLPGSLVLALAACTEGNSSPIAPHAGAGEVVSAYPTVRVNCSATSLRCSATASGGTGEGYSLEWSFGVHETYDADGTSYAEFDCGGQQAWRAAGVTVTDSRGTTASAYEDVYCSA